MRGAMGVLALVLAVPVLAQEATGYSTGENPFQAEYAFTAGQPIALKVRIDNVEFDNLIIAPEPTSGDTVSCQVTIDGTNHGGKVTATTVLLLEDSDGHALERMTMAPFRIKSDRAFSRDETIKVQSASVSGAARVYLFLKLD
jgi:hypothetical protein